MFDLLKENWVQDGIAAVFSTTTRSELPKPKGIGLLASLANTCTIYLAIFA